MIEMQTAFTHPALVPGRECGTCTICCKLPEIGALGKTMSTWCKHATPGKGCGIYDERPTVCRSFHCGWMLDASLGPEWKPERAKFYFSPEQGGNLSIMVDPGVPNAWRDERFYPVIKILAARMLEHGKTLFVSVGHRVIVVLPERNVDMGVIPDGNTVRVTQAMVNGKLEFDARIEPTFKAVSSS
jgi:hypothetical protein